MQGKWQKVLMVFGVIVLVLLAACSGSSQNTSGDNANEENESGSNDEEKVIDFMHLWPEGSSKQHHKIVNDIIAEFESNNPGIKVDPEILGNEQYKEKLQVLSTSNELPDVGMAWPAGFLEPYVEGDMFAPLDDLLEGPLKDQFVAGTAEAYQVDGSTYSLPLELNITPIYYNKAIFDEHGVEKPETFEELQTAIQTLADEGVTPVTLGNKDRWTGSMWYMYLADRIAGPDALNEAINGTGSFSDDGLIKAAEEIQNLVDMGAFVNGFNGLGNDEAKGYFINEQAAMYLMATWDLPEWTTNEDNPKEFRDSVEYMKFPTVAGGNSDRNSFVGGPGVGLFVAENSEVKQEAKDFVSFFVQEWGKRSVTDAGVIPATKVNTEGMDLPQMYIDILNDLNEASNLTLYADVQMSPSTAEVHLNMIQALFGGEASPQEFAEEQDTAIAEEE
ncbi:sugar ABC transporter extracellular binding protein [Gracilibacillus halophilus YIM-C55.5]|uniref:Sugar ABC transporter extracellular binding protein n=1 Tax=Gracilibacillus halophilus YIM-C55.5 TaxID=1308866 RepID=N4WBR1_9BACI|nr:extracellular solute-binding protein [Gracilibacillus halophilus]ENH97738.1 sugar ABC transporter extracellular binding protein [Gracilibacillus halophilus YIM-C55.5]